MRELDQDDLPHSDGEAGLLQRTVGVGLGRGEKVDYRLFTLGLDVGRKEVYPHLAQQSADVGEGTDPIIGPEYDLVMQRGV